MRIDAHQHFWRYAPAEQAWITEELGALRRDFLPGDLIPLLERHAFEGCVAVQARASLDETRWLLELADEHPWITGVVGWVDLSSEQAQAQIESVEDHPRLVGLRHGVQDETDDAFLLREDFGRGLALLERFDLAYDLLIHPRHLPAAIEVAARLPEQQFVLDHLAKPPIRRGGLEPWLGELRALAACENVACKLSGLVTEADWQGWTLDALAPFLDAALEAFGPERLMFGSDWPVCLLASSYERWYETVATWAADLTAGERDALIGGNASRVYRLATPYA